LFLVFILAFSAIIACGCVSQDGKTESSDEKLLVYCGAGMREPMDEIAQVFEEKENIAVYYTYGGSNTLLSQIELTGTGDIYMPGATYYFDAAKEKGYVDEEMLVVYHVPVIATPKGNPAGITSLEDLGNEGVSVILGDPEACAIGKLSDKILEKNNLTDLVIPNIVGRTATVNEICIDISLEQVDAGITWEDLYNPESMEIVYIPNDENIVKIVPIGCLSVSTNKEGAQKFIEFVTSEEGKEIFRRHGFTTYPDPKHE